MGDGQECQLCRRSKLRCECVPPYQVVGTRINGKSLVDTAWTRREADELCDYAIRVEKCDGCYVNRWVDGIGYVLDDNE